MEKSGLHKKFQVTGSVLRTVIRYAPDTGIFFWLEWPESLFYSPGSAFLWNASNAGSPIKPSNSGEYAQISIAGERFLAHRLAWFLHYGKWPVGVIDHINGQKRDNRISNLRDADAAINSSNRSMQDNNTSGFTGVRQRGGKFVAVLGGVHLGTFDTKEAGASAYDLAKRQSEKYTDRHGLIGVRGQTFKQYYAEKKAAKKLAKQSVLPTVDV